MKSAQCQSSGSKTAIYKAEICCKLQALSFFCYTTYDANHATLFMWTPCVRFVEVCLFVNKNIPLIATMNTDWYIICMPTDLSVCIIDIAILKPFTCTMHRLSSRGKQPNKPGQAANVIVLSCSTQQLIANRNVIIRTDRDSCSSSCANKVYIFVYK